MRFQNSNSLGLFFATFVVMKWITLFLTGMILCLNAAISTAAKTSTEFEVHMENDFSVVSNHITGPGQSQSYLTPGVNYLEVLSVHGGGTAGDLGYRFNLGGKLTDDENFDTSQYSLTHFNVSLDTADQRFSVGDILPFFSDYSLSSALKGASYEYRADPSLWVPEITMLYGQALPRWDGFWGGSETEVVSRQVYGARAMYRFPFSLKAGINVVGSRDSDPAARGTAMYDNTACAVDFHYQPASGLIFAGESAFNETRVESRNQEIEEDLDGYALRLRGEKPGPLLGCSLEYERVSPEFDNPLGSALSDREKLKFAGQYRFNKKTQAYMNFLWFRDNLADQKLAGRTDVWRPEVGIACKNLFQRPHALTRISYRKEIADRESEKLERDDRFKINYRDSFGMIETNSSIGINLRNHANETEDNAEYIYNTTLGSQISLLGASFKPNLSLGGWTLKEELSIDEDRGRQYAVGLGIDLPFYRISSSMSVGVNELEIAEGDDSVKSFGHFDLSWQPAPLSPLNEMMLYLKGLYNDFSFSTHTEDFREEKIMAGIKIKY